VVFTSPLVDPAPTTILADATLEASLLICELTGWTIRILSKSHRLLDIARKIPDEYRHRFILGVSSGTPDDNVARVLEAGTPLVSKRVESLHWLIRADSCEHVWLSALA
jgi:DNA repair photolyase